VVDFNESYKVASAF